MNKYIRLILFVGACALLINAIWLAVTTNMHHGHVLQSLLGVAVLVYVRYFNRFSRKIHLTSVILIAIPAICALALFFYGNSGRPDFSEDVVIVLGAGLNGEEVGSHLARRLTTAVDYLEQNPNAMVIVCGGLGAAQTITEAEAMARYLVAHGIAAERIIQEDLSTTTHENLLFAQEILARYFPDGFRAALITNDFHIFRATAMARDIGLDVVPLGAHTPTFTIGVNYLREMLAIVHFLALGW